MSLQATQIIRQEITPDDGKLRIKIILTDDSLIEFFEYVAESSGYIRMSVIKSVRNLEFHKDRTYTVEKLTY